jgi:4-alpha-glucanotransferase
MQARRIAGVLLHPTSLPGPGAVGDLGPGADRFLDWLQRAGASIWQILPLGPPGYAGSPYDSGSSFAGNTRLISSDLLAREGLLSEEEASRRDEAEGHLLALAHRRLRSGANQRLAKDLEIFRRAPQQVDWLEDWALYKSLRARFSSAPWTRWPSELRLREPVALRQAARELREDIELEMSAQFFFFRQWRDLRRRAENRGIELLGDLPYYVSLDSADVWCRPDLFDLQEDGSPRSVAGVPPDYFSADGQRWGNPIYRWDRLEEEDFDWWIRRLRAQLKLVHRLRIDHFRAFSAFWRIPASEPTAAGGRWEPGPGLPFFEAVRRRLGNLPLVAEDLGEIDDAVRELRSCAALPGMRVLQFAFDSPDSEHLPHNHPEDCLAYTGTHDNDTSVGWFRSLEPAKRARVDGYLGCENEEIHWRMIAAVMSSPAREAIFPMQDVLGLGSAARMNRPGTGAGNWSWRLPADQLDPAPADRLREAMAAHGRLPRDRSLA